MMDSHHPHERVALLFGGSLWIMAHLNRNMTMPNELVRMQR